MEDSKQPIYNKHKSVFGSNKRIQNIFEKNPFKYYITHYIRLFLQFLKLKAPRPEPFKNWRILYIAEIYADGSGDLQYVKNYLGTFLKYFAEVHMIFLFSEGKEQNKNIERFEKYRMNTLDPLGVKYLSMTRLPSIIHMSHNATSYSYFDTKHYEISTLIYVEKYIELLLEDTQKGLNTFICIGPYVRYKHYKYEDTGDPRLRVAYLCESSQYGYDDVQAIRSDSNVTLFQLGFRDWELGLLLPAAPAKTAFKDPKLTAFAGEGQRYIFNYIKDESFKIFYLEMRLIFEHSLDVDFVISKVNDPRNTLIPIFEAICKHTGYQINIFEENEAIVAISVSSEAQGKKIVFRWITETIDHDDIMQLIRGSVTYVGCTGDSSLFEVISCGKIPLYDCPPHKQWSIEGLAEVIAIMYNKRTALFDFINDMTTAMCPPSGDNEPPKDLNIILEAIPGDLKRIAPIVEKLTKAPVLKVITEYNGFITTENKNLLNFTDLVYYYLYYCLNEDTEDMKRMMDEFINKNAKRMHDDDEKKAKLGIFS